MAIHLNILLLKVLLILLVICQVFTLNGHFTPKIRSYNLIVPHKVTESGHFITFHIPHFYEYEFSGERRKRSLNDKEILNYGIKYLNESYVITLWPNHEIIAPDAISEFRDPQKKLDEQKMKRTNIQRLCHYSGVVKNQTNSRAAFSTCNGLVGFMMIGNKVHFIEPVEKHQANHDGQYLHLIYEGNTYIPTKRAQCGVDSNWERTWKTNLKNQAIMKHHSGLRKRSSKLSEQQNRYLELLVVCDKKFINYHKKLHDVETYILTIINMLSELFHDPSIGHDIDVQVVRIIYLEKEQQEIDLNISGNAKEALESFCKWQKKINPVDIKNPNHHDIAALITRQDLFDDTNPPGYQITGLSFIGTPCVEQKSCTINKDNGLILAFIMAHEIGHVLGCAHDEPCISGCESNDNDGSFFVMAPVVHIHTIRWSPCSRTFIEDLFENELGDCLLDKPEISLYKKTDILPGVVYDGQAQCEMIFPGSSLETYDEEKFCEELFCRLNETICATTGEIVVDGTKCGENKWCFQKECIEAGERPKAVNGGWSMWSKPTICSRSCGGGVTMTERFCNKPTPANGGRPCLGDARKYWICNTEKCPIGSPTFRDVQCAEQNSNSTEGAWNGYYKTDEPCVLYCINDEGNIRKIKPRVHDGTPCNPGTKNACIAGECSKVGCDFVINSEALEDVCGVCNGDGTECQIIEDIFRDIGHDYHEVATFPTSSRNIIVEELNKSSNIIALKDQDSKLFILNADHKESPDIVFPVDKTEAVYRHPEPDREMLVIKGPLIIAKILYICFFKPHNVGYKYRYAKMLTDSKIIGLYHWEVVEYEQCSANCEGGIQEPIIACVEEKGGRVSPRYCKHVKKIKALAQKCNQHRCHRSWRVGKWGKCHACEFQSGIRTRNVECVKQNPHPGAEDIVVNEKECSDPKPGLRELCNAVRVSRCRRRTTSGLPNRQLRDVYNQINKAISTRSTGMDTDIVSLENTESKLLKYQVHAYSNEPSKQSHTPLPHDEYLPTQKTKPFKYSTVKTDYDITNYDIYEETTEIFTIVKVREYSTKKCDKTVKVNVGDIVVDNRMEDKTQIIELPFKETSLNINVSDDAFEEIGDFIGDTLLKDQTRKVSSKETKNKIKKRQNQKDTPMTKL